MDNSKPPLNSDSERHQASLGQPAFSALPSPTALEVEERIHQLEEERDNLQRLVCHLLTKSEYLRQQLCRDSWNEGESPTRQREQPF